MRKSLAMIMTAVCLTIFVGNMTSYAAIGDQYCGKCRAELIQYGEHAANWTVPHKVSKTYSDGTTTTTKTDICNAGYSVDRTYYVCPNGHGISWYEDNTTVIHPSPICPEH